METTWRRRIRERKEDERRRRIRKRKRKRKLKKRRWKDYIFSVNCDILLRTLLMGTGLVAGEWEADHQQNKKMLYIIEPVVESLLQVA